MQIPKIIIVITQGGVDTPLRGSVDTGYDGIAVVRPALARQLKLPIVGQQQLVGFGGKQTVSIAQVDALTVQDSPLCSLKGAKLAVTEIPGTEEILLGEAFFKQFDFKINYQEGQPVVLACGEVASTWSTITSSDWFIPGAVLAGIAVLGVIAVGLFEDEPYRPRYVRTPKEK